MICPKCGAEIKEGNLYCESCGEEIRFVPDFEPEIEMNLDETLSEIREEAFEDENRRQESESSDSKKAKYYVIAVCVAAFLLVCGVTVFSAVRRYQENSPDFQLEAARNAFAEERFSDAAALYEQVLSIEDSRFDVWLELAKTYEIIGNQAKYLECLYRIARDETLSENARIVIYGDIISTLEKEGDYAAIQTLLLQTSEESILQVYRGYLTKAPRFSVQEGSYAEVIPLKLSAEGNGTIYYTLDGSIPDENSMVYTGPIFLDAGSHVVTAIYVDEHGMFSEAVAKSYVIDGIRPPAPDIEVYSGDYEHGTTIYVKAPSDCKVYYTTDGSMPTEKSTLYKGGIPMPLGKSIFRFICYNEAGVYGECTTRQYNLDVGAVCTASEAVDIIKVALLHRQRILDLDGTSGLDMEGRLIYDYRMVLMVDGTDYFVIGEIYENPEGTRVNTGALYAVNVKTQEYFQLIKDEDKKYVIMPM